MDTLERNLTAYKALNAVFRDGAYSSLALGEAIKPLNDRRDSAYVTRLFYGVISKSVQLDYILGELTSKRPKPAVALAIKIGLYMLRYMDEPAYAVINAQTELTKRIGKRELAGFVNAVLRRSDEVKLPINCGDEAKNISVNLSCPEWIVRLLIADYGAVWTTEFLSARLDERPHVRSNLRKITSEEFGKIVSGAEKTDCGYYAPADSLKNIPSSLYTVQSRSSVLAAECYAEGLGQKPKILDLCAAPGGKAVYLAYLTGGDVTACDIHPHRVELIRSYAQRMGEKVVAELNDATVLRREWVGKFDLVAVDAPCSGLGVLHSKPDIPLTRKPGDVEALSALQSAILETAAKYVKPGGKLCYSTCTVVRRENEGTAEEFLKNNADFAIEKITLKKVKADERGFVRLSPQVDRTDGFFVAAFRRTK